MNLLKPTAFILAACLPFAAQAHRSWMLPSSTAISGKDPWVTVDAAVSEDLFYLGSSPLKLDTLTITAPDGSTVQPENAAQGKFRSTFDVHLTASGTYKLALVNAGVSASYKLNGENKRWRGTEEALKTEIPADAQDVQVMRSYARIETFVTSGKPTNTVFKTTGTGLELVPITNPNDLFVGEPMRLQFLLDGKPAANIKVSVVPGGVRYRGGIKDQTLTTNDKGEITVNWEFAGMYWINASVGGGRPGPGEERKADAPPARRVSYSATVEVLPQ